ncbi:MAG: alpha-hydroxy-acid oxidizing protein [Steroidobacteraceae bacterium]|nr:alpha-hydroxy-acid oxidizing protein [Steroidobacteraceae bacterium]
MLSLQQLEEDASRVLERAHFDYFAGGAGDEITVEENVAAFARLKLRPRAMRGVGAVNLDTTLLGRELSMPIVVAPTAFHRLAHDDGECATARAAHAAGSLMIISMAATRTFEEIVAAIPGDSKPQLWFQVYLQPDRGFTLDLIRRAEAAGCTALVVTVDSPVFGRRTRDLRNGFTDLPTGVHCANLRMNGHDRYRPILFDATLGWDAIDWLRGVTTLPILVKGIAHPDDAVIAVRRGCAGIVVSNHGGRQLDSVAASIDLLPAIAAAVGGLVPIILDGGVRRGTDIVKALARGATAVAIGRPILWGLAVDGEAGVGEVLGFLERGLREALTLCGCRTPREVAQADLLVPRD